jgi:purine-binding chemotaxis protein CheW
MYREQNSQVAQEGESPATEAGAHLLFLLQNGLYALQASVVAEVIHLPELTPVEEAPHYVIGMFNLRGAIIPVIDLAMRLGHGRRRYSLDEHLIVAHAGGDFVGILVDEVQEVVDIGADELYSPTDFSAQSAHHHSVKALARRDGNIVMQLDVNELLHTPLDTSVEVLEEAAVEDAPLHFMPEATAEQRQLLYSRKLQLMQAAADERSDERYSLGVCELGGELFALPLEAIREFAELSQLTPVPCTPGHILGNANLRGDILTVIDIRPFLGMTPTPPTTPASIIVVCFDDIEAGIYVDEILDVMHLGADEMEALPLVLKPQLESTISATVRFGERVVSIVAIEKLLGHASVSVEEYV